MSRARRAVRLDPLGLWLVLALAAGARGAEPAQGALEVKDVVWGFDGRVVPRRINIVSIVLENPTEAPFAGVPKLYRHGALGKARGAILVGRPCLVPAHSKLRVHFSPYVEDDPAFEDWTLEWGAGLSERAKLPQPRLGAPARVVLEDPAAPRRATRLRAFDADRFPTTVAATDGLHSIVLDHVPRWGQARRHAFLDWLRRGGEVHLLLGADGTFPRFPDGLRELNGPQDRFRVGAGLGVRHPVRRAVVDNAFLAKRGFPAPLPPPAPPGAESAFEARAFRVMDHLTRPAHDWALIFVAIAAYLVVVGPVNYAVGRWRRDYRLSILLLLLAVGAFSVWIGYLGRRGHEETPSVYSLAYARHLGASRYDVTQWGHAFVTRGATYTISHAARRNVYATTQELATVSGTIVNGLRGKFVTEIPLFSARTFIHRAKLEGHDLGLKVVRWDTAGDALSALTVGIGPGFPTDVVQVWAVHGQQLLRLRVDPGKRRLVCLAGPGVGTFVLAKGPQAPAREPRSDGEPDEALAFASLVRPLIARALGDSAGIGAALQRPRQRACVQLFIFTRSPASFRIQGSRFGRESGYVVYHVDLFCPEGPHD